MSSNSSIMDSKLADKKRIFVKGSVWKKTLAAALLGICAAAALGDGFGVKAYASADYKLMPDTIAVNGNDTVSDDFVTSDNWLTPAVIHDSDEEESVIVRRGGELPEKYDSREFGWVTPVKDQGDYETCWSFASASIIETSILKNGLADSDINISENSIAYFFYNREVDKLGYTKGDYNKIARVGYNYLTAAGTLQGTGIELATGAGINTEDQSPYLSTPSVDLSYAGNYVLKNLYLYNYNVSKLDKSVATIKQAIMDHGSVACGIYMAKAYMDMDSGSYYCPINNGNHAITIVGWDDSYSRNNFVRNPGVDGAWIVKNSYGTDMFDNGYNYVSYADRSLMEFMAVEMTYRNNFYDNYYQHDGSGCPAYAYNKGSWYANVFKAKGSGKNNEELKAVGIYTTSVGTKYEIQVYTGLSSASKPTAGTKAFTSSIKGTLSDAGYQTVELPNPVSLTAGEYFSVAVRLTTVSGANAYIGVDSSYYDSSNDWIRFIAATAKNQSFVKIGGKWHDMGSELKANNRIKAYTDKTSVKSNFHLSSKELGVSKGDTQKLALVAAPNVHRKVTWKSANSKIAKVNINGAVKGKKAGTTTVTATFIAGDKKKTLKCKVTVGPGKMKGFSVTEEGVVKVSWKKNSQATGYEVVYSTSADGSYKKFADIKSKSKTSVSKQLPSGIYYVKMRPFKKLGKKKLYGSYTAAQEVVVP